MSVIKLRRLVLLNFKGIKNLDIDLSNITNIYGENKLGKTTIFDGFTWLLFDKDSKDRNNFEVQPLDEANNLVHMLETQVMGVLEVDGKVMELKKIFREKWVKKCEGNYSELNGTEILHFIDQIQLSALEYKEKINHIIDEQIFKLISDPLYFSTNMKREYQRKIILDIIDEITTEKVINYNPSLEPLTKLLGGNDIESINKVIFDSKKGLNENNKFILSRISELKDSLNDELDFDDCVFRKRALLGTITCVEEKLDNLRLTQDSSEDNENQQSLNAKKEELQRELEEINNSLESKEQNIRIQVKINELLAESKNLNGKMLELEEQEKLCEMYIKSKAELLELEVNSKFEFVRFKLFNTLLNGEVEDYCEILINGIPFSNANKADQINAGIDIINTLSKYYKISVPIFIDNRESINEILECDSQIINLIVSKDKKLVIEKIENEVA